MVEELIQGGASMSVGRLSSVVDTSVEDDDAGEDSGKVQKYYKYMYIFIYLFNYVNQICYKYIFIYLFI